MRMSHKPDKTMDKIKISFKLRDDKEVEPNFYLGVSMSQMQNSEGQELWAMDLDKYCKSEVKNI